MGNIAELLGKTITKIDGGQCGSDEILFHTSDGKRYKMWHRQDCCEHVYLEDIAGDVEDLIGSQVVRAEEPSNIDAPEVPENERDYSWTWTFYLLGTAKGTVTLRWFGTSNGYYCESVDFDELSTEN